MIMKNAIKLFTLMVTGVSMIFLSSCGKDEGSITPITIDFSGTAATVAENAGAQTVTILFDAEAPIDASFDVTITGTAVYGEDFTTSPDGATGTANVQVNAGDASATFTFTPIDNENVDGDKTVIFTISGSADGVELGSSLVYTITIDDEEGPSNVDFAATENTIAEDNGALTVTLNFGTTTTAPGTVDVTMTGDASAVTTDPAATADVFTVSSASGVDEVTFTVTPVDDTEYSGARSVVFTLGNATNGLELGSTLVYTLTINEDEATPIANLRAMYDGSADVTITTDSYISGVVTSSAAAVTSRNLFIQDASGAIVLRFDESHAFVQGDEIEVDITNASISDFNGLVQITNNLPLANGTKVSDGALPTPVEITLSELNTDEYQSQLISISSVSFVDANGATTLSGNQTVSDGDNTGIVRVESFATFKDELLPYGTGTLSGIAGVFNGTAQLLPQSFSDIFESVPTGTITVSQSITDFGEVATDESSVASQLYTVQSSGLTENISITSTNSSFKFSLDESTFSSSIEVDYTSSNAGPVSIYIEFSPTSGVAGVQSGTISHSSIGAVTQSFDVSGTETVANPPLFIETFETDGNGTRYSTSVAEFSDGFGDYFGRVATDGIAVGDFVEFTNSTGSYFAASDMDGDGNPASNTLTITGVDITGYTDLSVSISIAEDDDGTNEDWDDDTQFIVEYQIDGGGYQTLLAVEAKELREDGSASDSNKAPAIDTDFDGIGDGTVITSDFSEFVSSISGTGAALDIRISMILLDAGDEDIAFDNIKIEGTSN